MSGSGFSTPFSGLTQPQYDFLVKTSPAGFVPEPSRVGTYSNPVQNTADRSWQEVLRAPGSGYTWTPADQASWKQNCNFGPHNAGPALVFFLPANSKTGQLAKKIKLELHIFGIVVRGKNCL